jgi:hypothetical protein
MSLDALTWAVRTRFGSPSRKAVMIVLANYADEDWSCFPGQALIAAGTEMTDRSIRRILTDLEAEGWIARTRRHRSDGSRTSDRYTLLPDRMSAHPPRDLPDIDDPAYRTSTPDLPDTVSGQEEPSEEPPVKPPVLSRGPAAQQALIAVPVHAPPRLTGRTMDATWEVFWATYPRRVAKAAARKAWDRALRRVGGDASVIVLGAARYRDDPNREAQFTAHPATWLNGDRWEDEALPERTDGMNRTERALRRVGNQPDAFGRPLVQGIPPAGPPPLSIASAVFAMAEAKDARDWDLGMQHEGDR